MFISNMYNEVSGRTSNCQWLETVEQLNLMNIKTMKKTRLHGTKKEALTDLRSAGSFKKTNKNNRAAVKTPSDRIQWSVKWSESGTGDLTNMIVKTERSKIVPRFLTCLCFRERDDKHEYVFCLWLCGSTTNISISFLFRSKNFQEIQQPTQLLNLWTVGQINCVWMIYDYSSW